MPLNRLKRHVAARLRPFIEHVVREQLVREQALRGRLGSQPHPAAPRPTSATPHGGRPELPPDLRIVHIADRAWPGFDLVVGKDPGPYERSVVEARCYSDIAWLLNNILGGAGTLVDLGANIGTISMPVAAAGTNVIAVELLPANMRRLVFGTLVNGFARIRTIQAAASSSDGMVSYAGEEAWGAVQKGDGPQAMALRLDTIMDETALVAPHLLCEPFALKMDIEGHEYQALLGAERFLTRHRPVVLFESIDTDGARDDARRCKDHLVARGYSLFMLKAGLLIPKAPADLQEDLVADVLALPPGMAPPSGYEVRQPTPQERLSWLRDLAEISALHRAHAAKVARNLAGSDPAFAALSDALQTRHGG